MTDFDFSGSKFNPGIESEEDTTEGSEKLNAALRWYRAIV